MPPPPPPDLPLQPRGLSAAEAARRLDELGRNELERAEVTPVWRILARQFASPLIALLVVAAGVSAAVGESIDAVAIGAIVLLNGVVGFFQEHRAERAVFALRAMTSPRARVLRDGRPTVIPAAEVVPGDMLLLEAGDVVAADARLLEAHSLSTQEATLTGESHPVEKSTEPAPADAPLAERRDRVFNGTAVARGTGIAEVEATGMRTELGRIAHLLASATREATPLQVRLAAVSHTLLWLCLVVVALVAVLGWVRGAPALDVLLMSISLAVAAVPEGLPAVVTIALAVGVQRMARRNVLVRRLQAVETLGAATVICTDKTGTLTTGHMTVREVWGADHHAVLGAAAACCDAEPPVGDPTEVAIVEAARARGIERREIERTNPRVEEHPFDSERKRMSIRRKDGVLYVKGSVDGLLPLCVAGTEGAEAANVEMANDALRVLAVAVGEGTEERDLRLVGLLGLADPPRTEAIEAIATAREAGIKTVVITGDHPVTAHAIAREMGILTAGEAPEGRVHARVTPEDKLRIVRDWKARGDIVAMTGDGVNDAPALREAHIGVAMGRTGTEVTREAADLVLADDNFASIVAAVGEGRAIYDNIRKTVLYLLTGNAAELLVVLGSLAVGLPMPLLPLQILWINLVTDGLPALALVMDPPDPDVLRRPPRSPDLPMLGARSWGVILARATLEAAVVVGIFAATLDARGLDDARSLAFSTLVFAELFRAFAFRSPRKVLFEVGAFTNLLLVGVVAVSAAVQVALYHVPIVAFLLHLRPIGARDHMIAVGLGLVPVTVIEVMKLLRRAWRPGR